MKDIIFLLLTGLIAAYLCWYFYQRYQLHKALHNLYYLMGFAVLLVSGLLLIFLGMGILASPYVLTVASLIPLGISMGLAEEYFLVRRDRFPCHRRDQHRRHGHAQEDRRPALSRGGWAGHLRGSVRRQRRAEGILVGWHRRFVDRTWRHRPRFHFCRQTTAVLQPRIRNAYPNSPALPDDRSICAGVYEEGTNGR